MSITFDGPGRIIQLGDGQTAVSAQEIYEAWKDWVFAGNAQFPQAFRSIGGDPLGGGLAAGSYFFLNNADGWRIRPEAVDHELVLSGNLFGENTGLAVFLPALGDVQVLIRMVTSSLTQQTGGSGTDYAPALAAIERNTGLIPALL